MAPFRIQLRRITPRIVEQFQLDLREAGLGDPTIIKTLALLQSVLKRAVIWGHITSNPVALISKPPQRRTRTVTPPPSSAIEEMRMNLLFAGRVGDATLIAVLAYAGMRPGEALALEWADVRERTLVIQRAVALGEIRETKTRRLRVVRLLTPLANDLEDWRAASAASPSAGLVFPRADGAPWSDHDYRNWRKRIFRPAAAAAGLTSARPTISDTRSSR